MPQFDEDHLNIPVRSGVHHGNNACAILGAFRMPHLKPQVQNALKNQRFLLTFQ